MKTTLALILPTLAALALAACGSSGGGGTATVGLVGSDSLLLGDYQAVGIAGHGGGGEAVTSMWGSLAADGAGTSQLRLGGNAMGVINGIGAPEEWTYDVAEDGTVRFGTFLPGVSYLTGGLGRDGDLAAGAVSFAPAQPAVLLFGRRGGVHDASSLTGTWHFVSYGGTVGGPSNFTSWGTFTFDGMGGGSYVQTVNQEGAILGPAMPLTSTTIKADGTLTIDLGLGYTVSGAIVAGGQVILAAGGGTAGDNPVTFAMVRQAAGLSDADLAGSYSMVGMLHGVAANSYICFAGGMLADGMGTNQFLGLRNQDGVLTLDPADGMFSAVAPDGSIVFTTPGGDDLFGAMSPDGRVVLAAGSTNLGGDPAFFVFLK